MIRTYYIAADEVEWDYAPLGRNDDHRPAVRRRRRTSSSQSGPDRIGSKLPQGALPRVHGRVVHHPEAAARAGAHLGLLGPVIRAEVGDTIKIVFRNNTRVPGQHPPARRALRQEAARAPRTTTAPAAPTRPTTRSPPARPYTYTWKVPERAGPAPADGSSVMWMYHSHTDEVSDTYAGLIGPMVITRARHGEADGSPIDVDREFVQHVLGRRTRTRAPTCRRTSTSTPATRPA